MELLAIRARVAAAAVPISGNFFIGDITCDCAAGGVCRSRRKMLGKRRFNELR
jgi:hypothetical protein